MGARGMLKGDVKQVKASCSNIEDLNYLELVAESIIPLYESSDFEKIYNNIDDFKHVCNILHHKLAPFLHVCVLLQHFNNMFKLRIKCPASH